MSKGGLVLEQMNWPVDHGVVVPSDQHLVAVFHKRDGLFPSPVYTGYTIIMRRKPWWQRIARRPGAGQ